MASNKTDPGSDDDKDDKDDDEGEGRESDIDDERTEKVDDIKGTAHTPLVQLLDIGDVCFRCGERSRVDRVASSHSQI